MDNDLAQNLIVVDAPLFLDFRNYNSEADTNNKEGLDVPRNPTPMKAPPIYVSV